MKKDKDIGKGKIMKEFDLNRRAEYGYKYGEDHWNVCKPKDYEVTRHYPHKWKSEKQETILCKNVHDIDQIFSFLMKLNGMDEEPTTYNLCYIREFYTAELVRW